MEVPTAVAATRGEEFLLNEMYVSLQGESSLVGLPTIFVRLYTCNLRCVWCDSMHAVEGGEFERVPVDDVVRRVVELAGPASSPHAGIRNVCWTGGEPLLQAESIVRAVRRLPASFVHSIETDGEIDVGPFDGVLARERAEGRVRVVMDVKCPGSGMTAKKAFSNLALLRDPDEVKFVLVDRADYEFAKEVLARHPTKAKTVLFSPVTPAHRVSKGLDAGRLAGWIMEERLSVRLQVQLHKILWPGKQRGI